MKGTVTRFNRIRGYGFIKSHDLEDDIFFHYSSLKMDGYKTIRIGTEVEFELHTKEKGFYGDNIEILK